MAICKKSFFVPDLKAELNTVFTMSGIGNYLYKSNKRNSEPDRTILFTFTIAIRAIYGMSEIKHY